MPPMQPFPTVPRIGIGEDTHRLAPGGVLRLGGIDIPGSSIHAVGHSDADALLHAITDALLGAIAGSDIGRLFPDNDAANAGRDSADFIIEAMRRVRAAGYQLGNVDAVISLQRPKLADHIDAIRGRVAALTGGDISQVGLKAKTGESVGPIGRGEAIGTSAVVLLVPALP